MELMVEDKPLEFAHGDVTFYVKPKAAAADKFSVAFTQNTAEFMRTVIRQMVVGWKGVTSDGSPVRYSPEMLDRLPGSAKDNVLMSLGNFILDSTDITKEDAEAKKL